MLKYRNTVPGGVEDDDCFCGCMMIYDDDDDDDGRRLYNGMRGIRNDCNSWKELLKLLSFTPYFWVPKD
jgi:hypothetical protein